VTTKSPNSDFLRSYRAHFLIIDRRCRVITAVVKALSVDYNNFRRATAPAVYLFRLEETESRSIVFLITITGSTAGDIRSIVKVRFSKSDGRRSNGDNILGGEDSDKINRRCDFRTN